MEHSARLLITCPDQPGIVSAVTTFLYSHGVNVTCMDQHSTAAEGGTFFMRLEYQTPHLDISEPALEHAFADVVAPRFSMQWRIRPSSERIRTVLLVSKEDHALLELLWRWKQNRLPTDIEMVISNHPDLKEDVEAFGIEYHHIPVDRSNKAASEEAILKTIKGRCDLLVLARYMQILSGEFICHYPFRIINIHHSFLPAFVGANPYRQAYERGVKLIGATAHYATEELDAGPIIEQDVARVSHRNSVHDLRELGRDLERRVLHRAVLWHLEDRVIVNGNKTIVFAT